MSSNNVVELKTGRDLPPDFITRVDVSQMSDAELDNLVEQIKTRRMASFIIYQQTQEDLIAVREEKAKVALEKNIDQVLKTLTTLDKNLDKLETQIHKMRGLRIQAGLNVI